MQLDIYLNYPGNCEEAFRFYQQHLGAKPVSMTKHRDAHESRVPPEWSDKVLHAVIEIGGTIVRGADIPGAEPMRSAYLTLRVDTIDEAEHVYALLSEDGQVFMKMEETFFAKRFAMLRDKFGASWMLLHAPAA